MPIEVPVTTPPGGRVIDLVRPVLAPALALLAGCGALAATLWRLDWSALAGLGARHAWALLLVAGLLQLATLPLKAAGWQVAIGAIDHHGPPPPRTVLAPVAVGALINTVLAGRVGDAVRVVMVHARLRREGRPAPLSLVVGSAVTETLVSTVAWVVLVACAGLLLPLPAGVWAVLAAVACVLALIGLAAARGWGTASRGNGHGIVGRLCAAGHRGWVAVAAGHHALRRPRVLLPLGGAAIAGWVAQWASVWVVLAAFDVDGGWQTATLVLVSVSIAQTLPVVPGNVGVFQAAAALPLVIAAGVAPTLAVAIGVVLQLVQVLPIVTTGAVATACQGDDLRDVWRTARNTRGVSPDVAR